MNIENSIREEAKSLYLMTIVQQSIPVEENTEPRKSPWFI